MSLQVLTMWGPPHITLMDGQGDLVEMKGMFADVFYELQVPK